MTDFSINAVKYRGTTSWKPRHHGSCSLVNRLDQVKINSDKAQSIDGPGPWEAAHDLPAGDPVFEIDHRCERYGLTQNPDGYLRRTRA